MKQKQNSSNTWIALLIGGLFLFLFRENLSVISNIITAISTIFIAYIAYQGLDNWKTQKLTDKKVELIDEILDTVHRYRLSMDIALSKIELIRKEIQVYSELTKLEATEDNKDFIEYLQKSSKSDSESLDETLINLKPILSKIRLLVTKGEMLNFINYDKFYYANIWLFHLYNVSREIAYTISRGKSFYYPNPEVQKYLKNMKATIDNIPNRAEKLEESINIIRSFAQENYKLLLH